MRELVMRKRNSKFDRFNDKTLIDKYKQCKWMKLREKILMRDEYSCRECKRYGKRSSAKVVHHVYPAEKYPYLFYNPNNLISLCNSCHNKMHDRWTDQITNLGKIWQKRLEKEVKMEK